MKKCLILHGWEADGGSNWFPRLKGEMESKGYKVILPDLPNTLIPKFEEQIKFLEELEVDLKEGDLIFGHSLGCKLAMAYIFRNNLNGLKVSLVAPVYPGLAEDMGRKVFGESYNSISEYFNLGLDFKNFQNEYRVFLSSDDFFINMDKAKDYLKKLENVKFLEYLNMGHFSKGVGDFTFRDLLEY